MTNQFNKVMAANGKITNLFTNLLYNIRNQNYNGDQYGNINYLNYKNEEWKSGRHDAEICAKEDGSNWLFEVDKSSYTLQISV